MTSTWTHTLGKITKDFNPFKSLLIMNFCSSYKDALDDELVGINLVTKNEDKEKLLQNATIG